MTAAPQQIRRGAVMLSTQSAPLNDVSQDVTVVPPIQSVLSNSISQDSAITQQFPQLQKIQTELAQASYKQPHQLPPPPKVTLPPSKQREKKRGVPHFISPAAKVYAFAIKCYIEQMPFGLKYVTDRIKEYCKDDLQILLITHYRDLKTDGLWAVAREKFHVHILIRCTSKKKRIHVLSIMRHLGIYFRPGIDDDLWINHGVETIGNFANYAMYLTHETAQAIKNGKELYDVNEIISNLTPEEIDQVRAGYARLQEKDQRISLAVLEQLDKQAEELGYNMGYYEDWYSSLSFLVRSNAKMKTVRESYERGVDRRVNENTQLCRLAIFIQGDGNVGKTYAAEQALAGKRKLSVGGGGTGRFDNLRCDHEAIIVDDDLVPNLLNMADNKICRAYRRNSNNPVWSGKYLIITSNDSFREWVKKCGIQIFANDGNFTKQYLAVKSRFCIGCVLPYSVQYSYPHFYLQEISPRGNAIVQQERYELLKDFVEKYNAVLQTYQPQLNNGVNFNDLIEIIPNVAI